MGFLSEAVQRARRDLAGRPRDAGALRAEAVAAPAPLDFAGALASPGIALIAEVKRASPSAGAIAQHEPAAQAVRYEAGGAAAISVLTEGPFFGGSPEDLRAVRARTGLPVLRKDFVVDPIQVLEARAWGADAVLLIAGAVSTGLLGELLGSADELGMGSLVEAHGEADLAAAVASGATVVGVNARDLETLDVDTDRALGLAAAVPPDRILVLESGIRTREDVVRCERSGAHAVLVGEALMRAADPALAVSELLGRVPSSGPRSEGSAWSGVGTSAPR